MGILHIVGELVTGCVWAGSVVSWLHIQHLIAGGTHTRNEAQEEGSKNQHM